MATLNLTLRKIDGSSLSLSVAEGARISEVKAEIERQHSIAVERIKLIFKGRILESESTLASYGVTEGCTLHMVVAHRPSGTAAPPAAAAISFPPSAPAAPQPSPPPPPPAAAPAPFPAYPAYDPFGAATGGAEGGDYEAMMRQTMQMLHSNPQMQEAMLNSPMLQQMLDNPETLQAMIQNNPALRRMAERNPEVSQILNDPAMMREGLAMMRNPEMLRAVLRQQDLMISNIENIPEGYSALSQAYRRVQEPMSEAAMMMRRTQTPTSLPESTQTINSAPIPNLWGGTAAPPAASAPQRPSAAAGAAPYRNLLSSFSGLWPPGGAAAQSAPPPAPAYPSMGSAPPAGAPSSSSSSFPPPSGAGAINPLPPMGLYGLPPQDMAAMMSDPAVQQQMQMLMQNPEYMQSLMRALYPSLATGANPGAPSTNPAAPPPFSFPPGYPSPYAGGAGSAPAPAAGTGAPAPAAPFAFPFAYPPAAAAPAATPLEVLRTRYGGQLAELQSMGFTNEERVLRTLEACQGNVEFAANRLLE